MIWLAGSRVASSETSADNIISQVSKDMGSMECIQDDKGNRADNQPKNAEQLEPDKHPEQRRERVQADTAGKHLRLQNLAHHEDDAVQDRKSNAERKIVGHKGIQGPGNQDDADTEVWQQIDEADQQPDGESGLNAERIQRDDHDAGGDGDENELGPRKPEQRFFQIRENVGHGLADHVRNESKDGPVMALPAVAEEEGGHEDHDQDRSHIRQRIDNLQDSVKNTGDQARHGISDRLGRSAYILVNGVMIIGVILVEKTNLIHNILKAVAARPAGDPFHPRVDMQVERLGQRDQLFHQTGNCSRQDQHRRSEIDDDGQRDRNEARQLDLSLEHVNQRVHGVGDDPGQQEGIEKGQQYINQVDRDEESGQNPHSPADSFEQYSFQIYEPPFQACQQTSGPVHIYRYARRRRF